MNNYISIDSQRDESIKAYEITIVRDDGFSSACTIKVYDDGKIEAKVFTLEELGNLFQDELFEAVEKVSRRKHDKN